MSPNMDGWKRAVKDEIEKVRNEAFDEYAAMDERHLNSCIWIDPGRQSGQPCFGGTRIPVAPFMAIVNEAGDDAAKAFWPNVTDAHIKAGHAFMALLNHESCPLADLDNRCVQFGEQS